MQGSYSNWMLKSVRKLVGDHNALLLFYHKFKAWVAVVYYRNPSKKLKVIGVTGTNGKTTTVNLIAGMLEESGHKVGFTSTLRYKIGKDVWANKMKMTTQSPFFTQRMLREMVKAGCEYAIVEVTSHAMVQSRVAGINFDIGVMTNLTGDHVEYHGSFDEYMHAKGRFIGSVFSMRRKKDVKKVLVLNSDDAHFDYFNQFQADQKIAYGFDSGVVRAENVDFSSKSTEFDVVVPNGKGHIEMELLGRFNVYNALAAISVGLSLGISLEAISDAFKKIRPIGGRLEPINLGQDFAVIVDYAHTTNAWVALCSMFRPFTEGKIIFVGGATGGGRDKERRPGMGEAINEYADEIIVTDDDPYLEDRWDIVSQIASGVDRVEGHGLHKVVDREEAIRLALNIAEKGDTVLIAGKGGEEVFAYDGKLIPYDDRQVVRRILSEEIFSHVNY